MTDEDRHLTEQLSRLSDRDFHSSDRLKQLSLEAERISQWETELSQRTKQQPKQANTTQKSQFRQRLDRLSLPKIQPFQPITTRQNIDSQKLEMQLRNRYQNIEEDDLLISQQMNLLQLLRKQDRRHINILKFPQFNRQKNNALGSHLRKRNLSPHMLSAIQTRIRKVQKLQNLRRNSINFEDEIQKGSSIVINVRPSRGRPTIFNKI